MFGPPSRSESLPIVARLPSPPRRSRRRNAQVLKAVVVSLVSTSFDFCTRGVHRTHWTPKRVVSIFPLALPLLTLGAK